MSAAEETVTVEPLTSSEIARYAKTGCRRCNGAGSVVAIPGERMILKDEKSGVLSLGPRVPSKHTIIQHNDPDGPGSPAKALHSPAWREDQRRRRLCRCAEKGMAKDVLAGRIVVTEEGMVCRPAEGT